MSEETKNFFEDLTRKKSRFSQIEERLNLQDLGHHIRDGGDLGTLYQSSFEERENRAKEKLEEKLKSRFDESTVQELLSIIADFNLIDEDIYFSLGMKVGARLIILLTGNCESDF